MFQRKVTPPPPPPAPSRLAQLQVDAQEDAMLERWVAAFALRSRLWQDIDDAARVADSHARLETALSRMR